MQTNAVPQAGKVASGWLENHLGTLNTEAECLVNIESRLSRILDRFRGCQPEGVNKGKPEIDSSSIQGRMIDNAKRKEELYGRICNRLDDLESLIG